MTTQLSDKARAFLMEPRFGVLGLAGLNGGPPHLSVMWYELQGDEIMMNTKVGRVKDGLLRSFTRVSLCVEDGYTYVTVYGVARLIEDQAIAQADIKHLAIRYMGREAGEERARSYFSRQERVTIRMRIEQVTEHF